MAGMLKVIEVLAESDKSWEDAAAQAVVRASKTVHGIKSLPGVAEEAPGAYKDVSVAVDAAECAGLVHRVAKMRAIVCNRLRNTQL